jgi:hypothetical protein
MVSKKVLRGLKPEALSFGFYAFWWLVKASDQRVVLGIFDKLDL